MTRVPSTCPLLLSLLMVGLIVVHGCASPNPHLPPDADVHFDAVLEDGNFPQYSLQPGDLLEVLYNLEHQISAHDYVLDILDEVEIRETDHEELNGTYVIRTDGKISLPYKGSVPVAGLSVDEMSSKLNDLYSDIFVDAQIFVKLLKFGARLEELKRIISSERRGQIFEARVRPDGYVTLPVVGEVLVAGHTAQQIDEIVGRAYAEHYRGIRVSTIIGETPSNVFFVLGEVASPGQFPLPRPLTVTQALALSGVDLDTAGLSTVVVVNISGAEPRGRVLDIRSIFFGGDAGEDMFLSRDDVVFVPKTPIARADLFVQQYIERLFLFRGASFSYSVGTRN